MAAAGMGAGYAGIIGGVASHMYDNIGAMSPAARAQRQEFKKAKTRLHSGMDATGGGYGTPQAKQAQDASVANQQLSQQSAQMGADIARQRAGGLVSGGQATEENRARAGEVLGARAQVAAQGQATSNQAAQQQYAVDTGLVDAQAERARNFWKRQGDISMATTQGKGVTAGADAVQAQNQAAANKAAEEAALRKVNSQTTAPAQG